MLIKVSVTAPESSGPQSSSHEPQKPFLHTASSKLQNREAVADGYVTVSSHHPTVWSPEIFVQQAIIDFVLKCSVIVIYHLGKLW